MTETWLLLGSIAVLAAGTYAFRLAGPLLRERYSLTPRMRRVLTGAAVVLLAAVVATSALIEEQAFAGWARPSGVAVAGVLAWRGAPFVLVVLAAAGVTAGLRLLGVD